MSKTSSAASRQKLVRLVLTALLTALIIVMAFTPLGYLKSGAIEITFIPVPIVIGAVLLGPAGGAFLGAVFGITSFIQCFGMSTFGVALFSVSPLRTAIVCISPSPAQCGHAPCGLLNENILGSSSPKEIPCSSQA